jgi:hypothetical protein
MVAKPLQEFKYFWTINSNGFTLTGWSDSLIKPTQNLLHLNPNLNKPGILTENKVLIKSKQVLDYSWNNKNKIHKLIPYATMRREEEIVWYESKLIWET